MLGFFHSKNAWEWYQKKKGAEESSQIYISVVRMAPKVMLKKIFCGQEFHQMKSEKSSPKFVKSKKKELISRSHLIPFTKDMRKLNAHLRQYLRRIIPSIVLSVRRSRS